MQFHGVPYSKTTGSSAVLNACYPKGVTTGQLIKVVVKFLQDNPKDLHIMDVALIEEALHKAFPCSGGVR